MSEFSNAITGTWKMNHDGWQGTLEFDPSDQQANEIDGNCIFKYMVLSGKWSGGAGVNLAVAGTIGGRDDGRLTNEPCPASDHRVAFTIAFPGAPAQPFEGYVFTHELTLMAGRTWWQGMPFAWYALKG